VAVDADIVLVAHSHVPFIRRFDNKIVLNPGSIGQPRAGDTLSHYAVWQDGKFERRAGI
jgi:protein phosphatase